MPEPPGWQPSRMSRRTSKYTQTKVTSGSQPLGTPDTHTKRTLLLRFVMSSVFGNDLRSFPVTYFGRKTTSNSQKAAPRLDLSHCNIDYCIWTAPGGYKTQQKHKIVVFNKIVNIYNVRDWFTQLIATAGCEEFAIALKCKSEPPQT